MNIELLDLISQQKKELAKSNIPNQKVGILYNLIAIKYKEQVDKNIYLDIKQLINNYIDLIRMNNYGYDLIYKEKILTVINYLPIEKKESILYYLYSELSREFPELDRSWVHNALKKVRINKLYKDKTIISLFYALMLYSSMNILNLILTIAIFVICVAIILLPSPYDWMTVFDINYAYYSDYFMVNHLLNVIAVFADINNGFHIKALNAFGLFIQLVAKFFFFTLIVNFIYKKITSI